jgi:phage tail-like protein
MTYAGPNPTGNYIGTFHFRVTVEGINDPLDGFIRVSAVTSETERMEFKHGMDRNVRQAPGRTKFNDITLERVYSGLDEFHGWRENIVNGIDDRRTVSIEYLKPDGSTMRRYVMYGSFPYKWELPSMDAGSTQTAVEKITLAVEKVAQLA